jgi:hypothetical protein
MIQIFEDYAAHFHDMDINKHYGKRLTGDQIRILLISLPFVLRDLIAPEANLPYAVLHNMLHNMSYNIFLVRSPTLMPEFALLERVRFSMAYKSSKIRVISSLR